MLSLISGIDQALTDFFQSISERLTWTTFFVLLTGITIGFVLCMGLYSLLVMFSIRKDEKYKQSVINPSDDKMTKLVDDIKERYKEETASMSFKEKLSILGGTVYDTINVIAGEYYPDSKYPLYELTLEEMLDFLYYLPSRVDEIFSKKLLKPFKQMTVSQVFRFLDYKKKIEENKAIKAANKLRLGKATQLALTILNYANPVYWIKKFVVGSTVNFVISKTALVIIDVVADETNKTYSKSIFDQERNLRVKEINKTLNEIEREGENN